MKYFLLTLILCFTSNVVAEEIADIYLKDGTSLLKHSIVEIIKDTIYLKGKYEAPQVPVGETRQIVFPNGSKKQSGIILKEGAFSGRLESYEEGVWHFKLPYGVLAIDKPGIILSINLENPKVNAVYGGDFLATNVLEWIYTHPVFSKESTDSNWEFKTKKIVFMNNKITLVAEVKSWNVDKNCHMSWNWFDEKDRRKEERWRKGGFRIPVTGNTIKLEFPVPLPDSKSISIQINIPGGCCPASSPCSPWNKIMTLPAIPIKTLYK